MHRDEMDRIQACRRIVVHHAGGLGDSVLLWPMLRALARGGSSVTLVAPGQKAALAERALGGLGVRVQDDDRPEHRSLWMHGASGQSDDTIDAVVSWHAGKDAGPRVWRENTARRYPRSRSFVCDGRPDAIHARDWSDRGGAAPPAPVDPACPLTMHVGAGSEAKRWPIERWIDLRRALSSDQPSGSRARLIAGEAEGERFTPEERAAFRAADGIWIDRLDQLHDALRNSRGFIGADTGPTHLAAQLGLPTLSLFGPTDPRQWAPVGPRVRVVAPESPRGMDWLSVERVRGEVLAPSSGTISAPRSPAGFPGRS
jgi:heptosyltransferase III